MKRINRYLPGATVLVVFLGAVACGLAWLAGTTSGARWLLGSVSNLGGARISAGKVEGRLIDHLRLHEVRLGFPSIKIELASVEIRWKPLMLLSGTIGVQEITIQGARIEDSAPKSNRPPTLAWPRVSSTAEIFDVKVTRLKLNDLIYRRLNEQPLRVAAIDTSLLWEDKVLYLKDLTVTAPSGRVAGTITAGFQRPSLSADLEISPTEPVAGISRFSLQTRLLPGSAPEQLAGMINVSGRKLMAGKLRDLELSGEAGMTGNGFNLRRLRLAGKGVRGTISGEGNLIFKSSGIGMKLALQGKGFDILATGELNRRLTIAANIEDISRLIPETSGRIRADGQLRWRNGQMAGEFRGHARKLAYGRFWADSIAFEANGTPLKHTLNAAMASSGAEIKLSLTGAYSNGNWNGQVARFLYRDISGAWNLNAPAHLTVSNDRIFLSPLVIAGAAAERVEIAADLSRNPLAGEIRASWAGLNLAMTDKWLKDEHLTGSASGNIRLTLAAGKVVALTGLADASGTVTVDGHAIAVRRGRINFDGNAKGMRGGMDLQLTAEGVVKGTFSSTAPFDPAIPSQGEFKAQWYGIDLMLLKPWLPKEFGLQGSLGGQVTGKILPGQRFAMDGSTALSQGKVRLQGSQGELNINPRAASINWNWQGEELNGGLKLTLDDYGRANGSFRLPLPARFHTSLDPKGAVRAELSAQVREKGVLNSIFPGFIQESHGDLDAGLKVDGNWEDPRITGRANLSKAGAYLPTAGIHLKDVQLKARFEKDLIRIDSFSAGSGSGHIEGTALLRLQGWQVTGYQGSISGDQFQTIYFPELKVTSTPRLMFEGTPQKLSVRGEVRLPELRILGQQSHPVVTPSDDVIVVDQLRPVKKGSPLALDIQVRLLLGDRIQVKTEGIDARLGGSMELTMRDLDRINSKGEIRVIKGRYQTYGVNLEIVRGRLFYAGGPINQPTLDILALRTVGDVRAGVTIGGTLQTPVTKLYSEPAMPDVDILAYIVLGHPLGKGSQQASLLTQAASALLTSSRSADLQDQIKNRLGLSSLEISSGSGAESNRMGYKPITVTPKGTGAVTQPAGISQTMLTVGKYLTPQLYFRYGRSLFSNGNQFLLRYDIFKNLQIETQTGSESGVDLYYKIEFN